MRLFLKKEFYLLIAIDIASVIASLSLSLALRYEFRIPLDALYNLHIKLLLVLILKISLFLLFGLYRRMWQYAGIDDYLMTFAAVTLSSIILFIVNISFSKQYFFPRSVIIIDFILTLIIICGIRISVRIFNKAFTKYKILKSGEIAPLKRVLIYGAGVGGEQIAREISRNNFLRYDVIGFIDDDPLKKDMIIQNSKVLGKKEDCHKLVSKYKIDIILIAIPSLKGKGMGDLINYLKQFKVEIRTLPGQAELIDGNVYINMIRPVQIEDLLGREVIELDTDAISHFLKEKSILITGAGGSIGSEIARQVLPYSPKQLILLGKGENSIFNIIRELSTENHSTEIFSVIADVCDIDAINSIFSFYKPDIVFHAAAHKHVYLMEENPKASFKNNVLGSKIIMEAALNFNVEKFVFISTDKAVNPTSVMGATKRIAELIMSIYSQKKNSIFTAVRFGNVLGSRGSVVPIFKQQIEKGGPVTVTHPEVVRYFMTIPEASKLVIQAAGLSKGGEIFILDMGKPIKILDLAKTLIHLSGFEPEEEIEIIFTGLKPGEKLVEELLTDEEGIETTKYEKIFIAPKKTGIDKKILIDVETLNQKMYNLNNEEMKKEIFNLLG